MIGQDVSVQGYQLPDIVVWDPTLSVTSGRQPIQNNGCPDGYFAQFVGLGEPGSTPVPGTTYALRCRLMATTTPQSIVEESGITTQEAIDVYAEAVRDTAGQIGGAIKTGLSFGAPLLMLGLAAYLVFSLSPRRS